MILTFYVATNGNNKWSGRLKEANAQGTDGPMASLQGAMNRIRDLTFEHNPYTQINILVRGGEYFMDYPIILKPTDPPHLYFQAYPGETPILNGAIRITEWKETNVNGVAAWQADVRGILYKYGPFQSLFADGKRCPRTRLPKTGYYKIADVPGVDLEKASFYNGTTDYFRFAEGDIQNWKNLENVEIIVPHYWVEERMPLESVDWDQRIFRSTRRSIFTLTDSCHNLSPARYYVENVFEALTEPGQWYLDEKQALLYYIPAAGQTLANTQVMVPVLYQFFKAMGEPEQQAYIRDVRIEGLTLRYTDWKQASGWGKRYDPYFPTEQWKMHEGFILPHDLQKFDKEYTSLPQAAIQLPGVISLYGVQQALIENCSLEHIGWYGVDIADGCSDIRIIGNTITDIGGGGVKIDGAPADSSPARRTRNNIITDNHIYDGGVIFFSACGIVIVHSYDNVIAHNHIHDLLYTGISCGWVWEYTPNITRNNLIEWNHIHHLGKRVINDMGAIYMLGIQPGTILRNNLVHDVECDGYGGWGIYLDACSAHMLVENNIAYNMNSEPFHMHYGRENIIRNNIFAFGSLGQARLGRAEKHNAITLMNNIFLADNQQMFGEGYGADFETCPFRSDLNLFWDLSKKDPVLAGYKQRNQGKKFNFAQWQSFGFDAHSIVADPKFKNPKQFDFTLASDSPAIGIGFQPIDLSGAGIRPPAQRNGNV